MDGKVVFSLVSNNGTRKKNFPLVVEGETNKEYILFFTCGDAKGHTLIPGIGYKYRSAPPRQSFALGLMLRSFDRSRGHQTIDR